MREIAATVQRDDAAFAYQLISSIRQPYRDALQQYYKAGKSCSQMAAEEGITLSGMAHRKRMGLRMIRKMLMDD